jgi:hypothetical protein
MVVALSWCGCQAMYFRQVTWQPTQRRKPPSPYPPALSSLPYSDFKPVINSYAVAKWQESWDAEVHIIQSRIGCARVYCLPCLDELIIRRLRVGYTHLTHSHLLKGESPPMCIGCHSPLTVEFILIDCVEFALCWSSILMPLHSRSCLKLQTRDYIDFIKEIGLSGKL